MPDLSTLGSQWRERAAQLRSQAAAEGAARAYEVAASELEAALRASEEELLPLERAARISGFSTSHLARLVRTGRIRDAAAQRLAWPNTHPRRRPSQAREPRA